MVDDAQTAQAKKDAEAARKENAGGKNIPFGGTLTDLGEKDAVGVDEGK